MAKSRERNVQGMGKAFVRAMQNCGSRNLTADDDDSADAQAEMLHAAIRARGIDVSQLSQAEAGRVAVEVWDTLR